VNCPVLLVQSEKNGILFINLSAIPCASLGGSNSKKHEARTIAPSTAMPPEWFPISIARPRAGTFSTP
jgi:hypothetical protein